MKKLFIVFITSVLLMCSVFSASATIPGEEEFSPIMDISDMLSNKQEADIIEKINEVYEEWEQDVFVIILDSCGGQDIETFAEYALTELQFRKNTQGTPGILLVIALQDRDWYLQYTGTDDKLPASEEMSEHFLDELEDDEYYEAVLGFVEGVDEELSFPLKRNLFISLVIGVLVAFIVVGIMKSKLKSVRMKETATDYVRDGSFKLDKSRDLYLYSTVTRVARPKNNSNGGRSGGGGGSGRSGGGKF